MQKNFLFTLILVTMGCINTAISQSYTFQHETLPCLNKKFTIVAHVFPDSLGNYGVVEQDIKDAIDGMNVFFKPIMVSFELCELRQHPNFEHDTINSENEKAAIMTKYHADHRINFYFLSFLGGTEAGFAAGSIGDPDGSGIFIMKTMGVNAGVFAHEMGHFCSLAHTFEGNGTELVNGGNCATEGDQICDTPADPFTPGATMSDFVKDCRFISLLTDANGEYYNPDLGNIMSYYQCGKCGFTWMQLDRMAQVIKNTAMTQW